MRRAYLLMLLVLVPASTAHASGQQVIRDCTDDGRLEGHYSQKDLRSAQANLPSDVAEYTNCADVIRAAQLGTAGGSAGGGGAAGATSGVTSGDFGGIPNLGRSPLDSATPAERAAVTAAATVRTPVVIDRTPITPGSVIRRTGFASTVLPAPLIAALIVLLLGALAATFHTVRGRVGRRRR